MQVTPSRMFLGFCLGFLLGVALTGAGVLSAAFGRIVLGVGVGLAIAVFPSSAPFGSIRFLPFAIGLALVGIGLGSLRMDAALRVLQRSPLTTVAGDRVTLTGRIPRSPTIRIDRSSFLFDVRTVNGAPTFGRVLVTADRTVGVSYGDVLEISGKLSLPRSSPRFDERAYLARDGVVATLRADRIAEIGWEGKALSSMLDRFRRAIDRSIGAIVPSEEGALLGAILTGDEGSMSAPFKEALNRAGLRHIVAVSGMNITIIMGLVIALGIRLGLRSAHAVSFAAIVVALFVALIGFPASAVRAALMAGSMHAAKLIGRRSSGMRAAVFAATAMVALSPFVLLADIGFQLSFLAVIGIIAFLPSVRRWFGAFPGVIRETLAMMFAAQLAVMPMLLRSFGSISLVAPATNLLVVPMLPFVTVIGALAVFAGMIAPLLGTVIAAPLVPYLMFVRSVAERSALLPVLSIPPSLIAPTLSVLWYGALAVFAWRCARRAPRPIDLVASQFADD